MKGTLAVPVVEVGRLRRFQLCRGSGSSSDVMLVVLLCRLMVVVMVMVAGVLVMDVNVVAAGVLVEVETGARDSDTRHEQRRNQRHQVRELGTPRLHFEAPVSHIATRGHALHDHYDGAPDLDFAAAAPCFTEVEGVVRL